MHKQIFNIRSHKDGKLFLHEHFGNVETLGAEFASIHKWPSESWRNVGIMENDVLRGVDEIIASLISEYNEHVLTHEIPAEHPYFIDALHLSVECQILHDLHDNMMGFLYEHFKDEDEFVFDKCKTLSDENVSIEDFGSSSEYAIALPASVVELANLDNHHTALDKLNCLTASYDLIYAELKMAFVEVIAESSDETGIPVINSSEVVPILMGVIVKAKPKHLYSNFYYIEAFGSSALNKEHARYILKTFQSAIQGIVDLKGTRPNSSSKHMDIFEYSKFATSFDTTEDSNTCNTLQTNQMRRFTRQVTASLDDITK